MVKIRPAFVGESKLPSVPAWLAGVQANIIRPVFAEPDTAPSSGAVSQAALDPKQIEQKVVEARRRAEDEGRRKGESEGRARYAGLIERLESILADLESTRQALMLSAQEQLTDLAVCVAEALLGEALQGEVRKQHLQSLVQEAVGMITEGDEVEITVSPKDQPMIAERMDAIQKENPRVRRVFLKTNEAVTAGCVVETRLARIDATVEARLRNIAQALRMAQES